MAIDEIILIVVYTIACVASYFIGNSIGTKNALKKRCVGSLHIITEDDTFSDGVMKIDIPYEIMPRNDYASIRIIFEEKKGESVYDRRSCK